MLTHRRECCGIWQYDGGVGLLYCQSCGASHYATAYHRRQAHLDSEAAEALEALVRPLKTTNPEE